MKQDFVGSLRNGEIVIERFELEFLRQRLFASLEAMVSHDVVFRHGQLVEFHKDGVQVRKGFWSGFVTVDKITQLNRKGQVVPVELVDAFLQAGNGDAIIPAVFFSGFIGVLDIRDHAERKQLRGLLCQFRSSYRLGHRRSRMGQLFHRLEP